MQLKQLDERLSIGGQIAPEEVAHLSTKNFVSIVCNRPGDVDYGQPSFAEIAAAAAEHGFETRHIAISGQPGPRQVVPFATVLRELSGPVFAYCRSGGRAATLATVRVQ